MRIIRKCFENQKMTEISETAGYEPMNHEGNNPAITENPSSDMNMS